MVYIQKKKNMFMKFKKVISNFITTTIRIYYKKKIRLYYFSIISKTKEFFPHLKKKYKFLMVFNFYRNCKVFFSG
jgi:hypothetical protein